MNTFLDEVQLKKMVPSIFATGGSEKVSDRYGFIPTIEVVRGMEKAGFYPVKAMQMKSRTPQNRDFGKHLIRFRHRANELQTREGLFPEIVLLNSHDGSSSYQLRAGVYRMICSNGLIVGNECFERRIKHAGDVIGKVVDAADELISKTPETIMLANEWSGIELNQNQKMIFAESAAMLKWNPEIVDERPFAQISQSLIDPVRYDDYKNDLWTTFNVIQENMIRGGIRYRTDAGSRQRTRDVNSVTENVRLNTSLWTLTSKMAELAKR